MNKFICEGCQGEFFVENGYCPQPQSVAPWENGAKWYCGKCYRELPNYFNKKADDRGPREGSNYRGD